MKTRMGVALILGGLGVAAVVAVPAWAASSSGNLIEFTMRATEHMQGMSPIPPHTFHRKACTKAGGKFDPNAWSRESKMCKMEHYERKGDTVTFDQVCHAGGQVTTTHGVFHGQPDGDFAGTTTTSFNAGGRAITAEIQYTGKRIGSCTYEPPKSSS